MNSESQSAFIAVYDTLPATWEDGRKILVERLRELGEQVNNRSNGYYSDSEYPSGNKYPPGVGGEFRDVFRIVVNFGPLAIGLNTMAHGITFDANFTLTNLYAAATQDVGTTARSIPNGADTITMDATNIYITVASAYTRCYAVLEYMGEL